MGAKAVGDWVLSCKTEAPSKFVCAECLVGTFSSQRVSTACDECGPGHYSGQSASSCERSVLRCASGRKSNNRSDVSDDNASNKGPTNNNKQNKKNKNINK
eukprot:3809378-Amphidinium_carterae.1